MKLKQKKNELRFSVLFANLGPNHNVLILSKHTSFHQNVASTFTIHLSSKRHYATLPIIEFVQLRFFPKSSTRNFCEKKHLNASSHCKLHGLEALGLI